MIFGIQLVLFDDFGSPVNISMYGPDFADDSKAPSTDFLDNGIVIEIIFVFHFDERIPIDFDCFYMHKCEHSLCD